MHSSFRISNSSDSLPLNVGTTSIQKLQADKRSEEFKIYVELGLEATKLSASTDDEEDGEIAKESETLLVEPHSFNVVATPLTKEFLIAEEKAKAREAARIEKENETFNSEEYDSEPLAVPVERKKNVGRFKPNTREPGKVKGDLKVGDSKQIYRRSQNEKERVLAGSGGPNHGNMFKDNQDRKPPDILLPTKPTFNSPLHLPNLPTTPIPVSELPPTAVRSPPMKSPPINPLLQNLTPIPPKQYTSRPPPNILNPQAKPAPTPSPARAASSDLISIQVPMAGPDGSQTLQTINVPRSVLAGASDRPILLTVTPKNGINKGQKQIVVLTKNTNGTASASSRTATISTTNMTLNQKTSAVPVPGSPSKSVQLSPRAQLPTSHPPAQLSQTSVAAMLAASQPVNPALATHRSTQQQQGQPSGGGVQQPARPHQQVVHHQQGVQQVVQQQPQQVVQQQPQQVVQQQPQQVVQQQKQHVVQQQQQVVRQQVIQQPQAVVRQGAVQTQPGARTVGAGQVKGGQQVIRGHIVQTSQGQVLVQGNKQILLGNNAIQNGRLVLNQAQLQALTGAVASSQPVASGAQAKVLPGGQGVNKAVGGGQVRTQVISAGGQPVRTVMSVTQIQSMVSGGQLQTVIAGGRLQTVVSGSQAVSGAQTPGRANPGQVLLSPGQVGQVLSSGGVQKVLTMSGGQQVVRVLSAGNGVQQGGVKPHIAVGSPRGQIGNNSAQQAAPQAPSLPNGNSMTSPPSGGGGDSLSRIMAALHNRGLVSQQNGKFYYVGDKSKSPVSISPGTAVKLAATTGITTSPVKPAQPTFSPSTGLNTAVSGITSLSNLNTGFSTPRTVSRMNNATTTTIQQSSGSQNTVVVANAASLDSYTADSSLLEMANTLLQSPVSSFSPNSTVLSPQAPVYSSYTNGQAEVSPLKTTSQGEINNQTFYYRDLGLPVGWYIRIDKRLIGDCSYEVDTSFFSPDGACLKSQRDISAYLTGQLIVEDLSHKAPVSVNLLPWKDDLNEINKQFVPNIDISGSTGFAPSDATSHNFLKRSLSATQDLGICDEKKSKPENFLFL